jgi:carbon-monoxide dehydrogenase small subunit
LILAAEVDGQEITTVEGVSRSGLSALQKALLRHNSFQCGFCSPGIVLAATELLNKVERPTVEQIREAISGNLCRCTGYQSIVEAIAEAGRTGHQDAAMGR